MKKFLSRTTKLMIVSFIIVIITFIIFINNIKNIPLQEYTFNESKNIGYSEGYDKIYINTTVIKNINIIGTDESNIRVEAIGNYTSRLGREFLKLEVSDMNDVSIRLQATELDTLVDLMTAFYPNGGHYIDISLNVYIPKKYHKIVEVQGLTDNFKIENLDLESLNIFCPFSKKSINNVTEVNEGKKGLTLFLEEIQ